MRSRYRSRSFAASVVLAAVLASAVAPAFGQVDIVPVSDISGGSSVFILARSGGPRRFASNSVRSNRSKAQRAETARKIRRQYEKQAEVAPPRDRSKSLGPEELPRARTMPKEQASRVFTGVGEWYIDRGETDNAIGVFREAIALDGKNLKAKEGLSDALSTKGSALLDSGEPLRAKGLLLEALKNDPKNAKAYFGMGELLSENPADIKEAIAAYENALKQNPKLTEIYQPLGILYYQNGEIAKADDMLTKALAISADSADTQLFLGSIRLSQNNNSAALAAFERAKAIEPGNADAWNGAGDAYLRMNNAEKAVAEYKQATTLKANFFEAWTSLGNAYVDLKKYELAAAAFTQANRLKNTDLDTILALADAQRLAGNFNAAAGWYRNASDLMSRTPGYSQQAQADVTTKFGFVVGQQCILNIRAAKPCDWTTAIAALQRSVELGGGDAATYANLGWAYYNAARVDTYDKKPDAAKRNTELARTNLEKAVALNPPYAEGPLLNLGMARTDLGDYTGAAEALEKVVKKQPGWAFAWNELGIAYRKKDDFKKAVEQYKRAVDADEKFAAAWYNYGEASLKLGKLDDARKAYQKLSALGATNYANSLVLMSKGAVRK